MFIGVVLKHKNLALATQSNMYGLELPEDAILLSYLPLAHIYEVLLPTFLKDYFSSKISSASANFAPPLLVERLVISLGIHCVSSRMPKS